jgi:membrane associated rhomboid family serine protease
MIPIGDASRKVARFPIVTVSIILVNVLVFLVELAGGDPFILRWSMVPANITHGKYLITILTSIFMHAGWEHIIGNMIFFWAFGPEIEDAMGHIRFLIFYLIGGIIAALAQIVIAPSSTIPNLGASGAIAAVMGAFLITYPRDRIRTVFFLGFYVQVTLVPAILLVGLWFLTQLFSEVGALAQTSAAGGVAYMAHIGGFLYGAITARLFEIGSRPTLEQ